MSLCWGFTGHKDKGAGFPTLLQRTRQDSSETCTHGLHSPGFEGPTHTFPASVCTAVSLQSPRLLSALPTSALGSCGSLLDRALAFVVAEVHPSHKTRYHPSSSTKSLTAPDGGAFCPLDLHWHLVLQHRFETSIFLWHINYFLLCLQLYFPTKNYKHHRVLFLYF